MIGRRLQHGAFVLRLVASGVRRARGLRVDDALPLTEEEPSCVYQESSHDDERCLADGHVLF